jgi:hypothetical protein
MRDRRSITSTLLALGLVLAAAATVMAKDNAIVTLDDPLPTHPAPGSTITLAWTLDIPDGAGSTLPFNASGVFVRFSTTNGAPLEVTARQDRKGHYSATLTVPDGGLGSPVFGLAGEACVAGRGCERSDMLFRVATEARQPGRDPVAAPVAPAPLATVAPAAQPPAPAPATVTTPTQTATSPASATIDLTLLPLVALVGIVVAGLALLIRGRGRAAAT